MPAAAQTTGKDVILDTLRELKGWEGWENFSVVAAKAYASFLMREAFGLDQPNREYARLHLEYQGQDFERYKHSLLFNRNVADNKVYRSPKSTNSL